MSREQSLDAASASGAATSHPGAEVLRVEHLQKHFDVRGKGRLHAVDDVSFSLRARETLGLVGESGCGKSTIGNLIVDLLQATDGHIYVGGKDVVTRTRGEMFDMRAEVQMIFQDPYSSLNPRKTVRSILAMPLKLHGLKPGKEIDDRIDELIGMVGLEPYVLAKYPHELDGGKRQMVGIARALSLNPKVIVCDEPVSALDVSVQATIINLLIDLQREMGLAYLFVSHDLSVVRHISTRVAVMYLGQIVEIAETDEIFANATHPYTIALLSAVPRVELEHRSERIVLRGDVPSPLDPEPGCRFAKRCWMAREKCALEDPPLIEVAPGHRAACHFWEESQSLAAEMAAVV